VSASASYVDGRLHRFTVVAHHTVALGPLLVHPVVDPVGPAVDLAVDPAVSHPDDRPERDARDP
jgi:hypothetical protein